MTYQKIHDSIINRARKRNLCEKIYTEKHHIIPKCEGGLNSGEVVHLTHKEHRLIHFLRYKINGVLGNLLAYNMMNKTEEGRKRLQKESASIGAKSYHKNYKNKNPEKYYENQKKAGIKGGIKCVENKLGFFSLSFSERQAARKRGADTLVREKIGMFSDEFREKHKILIQKKIKTPDGIFESMIKAAEFYKVVPATITYRVNNWKNWNYINEKGELDESN